MRILFVVPYTPNLIRVRPYNFIRALAARRHELTVLTLTSDEAERQQVRELRQICDVIAHPLPRWRSLGNVLLALPGRTPLQANYCWQPALAQTLRRLVQQNDYDVVHIEHLRGARYGVHLRQQLAAGARPPIVWDSVDCITALFRQAAVHSKSLFGRFVTRFELGRTQRHEQWLLQQFEQVLVTSPADREELMALAGSEERMAPRIAPISVVANGVDLDAFRPDPTRPSQEKMLVFSGKMSYHANVTMALYLAQEIMPRVWAHQPDARLTIVGKDPPREIVALGTNEAITVTGAVDAIQPYLQQAAVAVAPLRYGAGIQNKILEAMACGTAVVTTPTAMRALKATPGRDLLVAGDAAQIAASILVLLADPARRKAIAAAGQRYVRTRHDWDAIAAQLEEIYSGLHKRHTPP